MKKPVLALLSIILLTAGCSQRPAATTKIPLTSAHRGAATIAPENTMASVDSCIKYGVGNIECDVCISKDSVFYVLHDSTLDRFRQEVSTDYFGILLLHCMTKGDWAETRKFYMDGLPLVSQQQSDCWCSMLQRRSITRLMPAPIWSRESRISEFVL